MSDSQLKINEIFLSIQGEGTRAGRPCVLIRLTGCNLNCAWCDTRYAATEGELMPIGDVLKTVRQFGCKLVELTGGEPLCQPGAAELLTLLCDEGFQTLVETNGSIDISGIDSRVIRIVDFKCPSSGESDSICQTNAERLTPRDEVKFVIADRTDYEFALRFTRANSLTEKCTVIFSPVATELPAAKLAEWILFDSVDNTDSADSAKSAKSADSLDIRLGLQLHKIIWPDKDRGV